VSIVSTFYSRLFVKKCFAQLFSSYILALAKVQKHFHTKNTLLKCWWNWPQELKEVQAIKYFMTLTILQLSYKERFEPALLRSEVATCKNILYLGQWISNHWKSIFTVYSFWTFLLFVCLFVYLILTQHSYTKTHFNITHIKGSEYIYYFNLNHLLTVFQRFQVCSYHNTFFCQIWILIITVGLNF